MWQFKLFGIPVSVSWTFGLMALLFSGALSAQSPLHYQFVFGRMLAIFVAIMVHELGHALVARHHGARTAIVLHGMGGLALRDRSFDQKKELAIILAGPAFGIALWFIAREIPISQTTHPVMLGFVSWLVLASLFLNLFNLLPVLPLDGGQALLQILGKHKLKQVALVGLVVLGLALAYAVFQLGAPLFLLMLIGLMGYENYKIFTGKQAQIRTL